VTRAVFFLGGGGGGIEKVIKLQQTDIRHTTRGYGNSALVVVRLGFHPQVTTIIVRDRGLAGSEIKHSVFKQEIGGKDLRGRRCR
jgi:hypothetical protein